MFKRFVLLVTMYSVSTLFFNSLPRARAFISPSATKASAKAKKRPCAPCSAGAQSDNPLDQLDSLATLGRSTQSLPFAPLSRSLFEGTIVNLVSTATGHLAFSVTDLSVSGIMPIKFQRIYTSDRNVDTGLGAGWSYTFDDRITVDGNTATLAAGTGSTFAFRRDGESQRFALKTDEPNAHQTFSITDPDTITEQAGGLTRTYKKLSGVYRLSQIADSNGNKITVTFDARGNITRIGNDSGGAFVLEWSDSKDTRLLSVTDNTGGRVSFRQDGQRIRAVTDSSGAQLTYDYEDGRLLTRATDPAGRTLLRVRYDKAGRVLEAGDAAGTYLYQYDTAYGISRRTTVTDPIGVKTIYEQTERGLLASISDGEGTTARIEYNAANRAALLSDTNGNQVGLKYDAQNRLLHRSATDGTDISYAYDEQGRVSSVTDNGERTDYTRDPRGNIIAAKNSDPAKSYSANVDARGQTLTVKSASGREVSLEYDAAGNEKAFALSNVGRFQTERDAAGRITLERLPSGSTQSYQYDSRGRIVKLGDNRGNSITFERDAGGAMIGLVMPNGSWVRATRDDDGRIVAITNSKGKSRRFAYDARGALVDYTDALGKHKKFGFDKHGRVHDITDNDGNKTVIERDSNGRPQHISFSDGTGLRYEYDRAGKMVRVKHEGVRKDVALLLSGFSLNHLSARSSTADAPQLGIDCLFGGDGFYDYGGWDDWGWSNDPLVSGGMPMFEYSYDCYDPFGGYVGCSSDWYGGYDSWYVDPWSSLGCSSFGGVDCGICIARQLAICASQLKSCGFRAGGGYTLTFITCLGLGVTTLGIGVILCLVLAGGSDSLNREACNEDYRSCLLAIPDKCPQCGG